MSAPQSQCPGVGVAKRQGFPRWFISKVRLTVRHERVYLTTFAHLKRRYTGAAQSEADIIADLARRARVDWLFNAETGEVRFFEFA